jgi:hypothetical protein
MRKCERCKQPTTNKRYCSKACSDAAFGTRGNVTRRVKYICIKPECGKYVTARGLCQEHYDAARSTGTLPPRACPCGTPVPDGKGAARCLACIKRRIKASQLRCNYGIDIDEYEQMLKEQGDCCAICKSADPSGGTHSQVFPVDHDHVTGRNRGLLCNRCNPGIGYFNDSPALLRAAADYLESFLPASALGAW